MGHRYSHTQLQQYATCPRQFSFKNIEKFDATSALSADLKLGAIVHDVLKSYHQLVIDGIPVSLQQVEDWYDREWDEPELRRDLIVPNELKSVDDYIAVGRRMVQRYVASGYAVTGRTILATERQIQFQLPGTAYQLTARIDLLSKTADGYEITDFKTGSHLPQGVDSEQFLQQMGLYQLAIESIFPQFQPLLLSQYFLKFDEQLRAQLTPERRDELIEQLRLGIVEIENARRFGNFPAREGGHCTWCAYQKVCPAKRLRFALADESGAGGAERTTMERLVELAESYIRLKETCKSAESELEALRAEIIEASKSLQVSVVPVKGGGRVSVAIAQEQKFPTRSDNPDDFAELSFAVRSMELDDCFELNTSVLLKEFVRKEKLSAEQLAKIERFLTKVEKATVRAVRGKQSGDTESG